MHHDVQKQILDELLALHKGGRDQPMLNTVVQLPVGIYTDPDILANELASVFRNHPMLIGHASSVREPGSYLLGDWEQLPYVIVRNKEGQLRAFLNVCRHRGARIVSGSEPCLKAFVCPFHGWSYDLNGELKGITKPYNFPGLDRSQFSLIELPVAERAGLIWVHPTPGAAIDLNEFLGPVGDDFDNFDLSSLVTFKKTRVVKKANWKILIKTYLEGYHVPYLHRNTLSYAFRNGVIAYSEYGSHMRLAAARTNFKDMMNLESENRCILDFASVYYSIFPNAFFIMHPDYVSINLFYPEGTDQTIWTHEMLYRPELFEGESGVNALEKRFSFTNDIVFDQEDFSVAEEIQCQLRSGGNKVHTLGLEEGLLVKFQQNIERAIDLAR